MNREYNGLIFTNHALERMRQRQIKQGDVFATFKRADLSRKASTKGAYVYYKRWGNRLVEVVAKKNNQAEWVVLSVWDKNVESSKYQLLGSKGVSKLSIFFHWMKKLIIG